MRYLRTDDINGAQPKHWGMGVNKNVIAGNPSGAQRSYKNESHIFNHIYESANINSHFTRLPLKTDATDDHPMQENGFQR